MAILDDAVPLAFDERGSGLVIQGMRSFVVVLHCSTSEFKAVTRS